MRCRLAAPLAALCPLLVACSGPTVRLSTAEPLEVDVTMRVDIYQHGAAVPSGESAGLDPAAAEERRRARMAEIQALKNSRLVGENRRGLLTILELPPGEYGGYVERTVKAENADRNALMKRLAAERREPLARIESEQARLWRERAFPGEWVEEQQDDGVWRWVQKRAAEPAPG
jgi:uncharacterized protein YdbL (DUF1318 family)